MLLFFRGGSGSVLRDDRELVSISTSFPLNGPPVTVHTTRDSSKLECLLIAMKQIPQICRGGKNNFLKAWV